MSDLTLSEMETIDYSDSFPNALRVDGRGSEVLMLYKLNTPRKNLNGDWCAYELEHRWLSADCTHDRDESWCCVLGSEVTLWTKAQIDPAVDLFDQVTVV